MKVFYLIFFLFSIAFALNSDEVDRYEQMQQFTEQVQKIQDYCLVKENITRTGGSSEEQEEEISEKVYEWHCFLECVASEMGIVS